VSKSTLVTTNRIEELTRAANRLYAERMRYDRRRAAEWRGARVIAVNGLHSIVKPAARPYAGLVLADLAEELLAELCTAFQELVDAEGRCAEMDRQGRTTAEELARLKEQAVAEQKRSAQAAAETTELRQQLEQARINLVRRPAATSLVLPAQKITVESPIQLAVLRLLAAEGLGRVWRIVERVLADGLTGNANTVRNAVNKLDVRELLADYDQHGKDVGWAYKAGGTRRLVQLTPTGRQWCHAAFGREPVESEIAAAARRHKSVSHGIAVLEAAHHLAAAGYKVETEPEAVLATADEPWRARAEPDLAFTLSGEVWPAEVQREVSKRLVAKWIKSLELNGRLALVLYSEEARQKQQMILFEARCKLPVGRILLSSIEAMDGGGWAWEELTTPR
jgi:hypothetical protein